LKSPPQPPTRGDDIQPSRTQLEAGPFEESTSLHVDLAPARVETDRLARSTIVVAASGEFDLYTVPKLTAGLADALAASVRHVIVDLTSVTFFDSAALLALTSFRNGLAAQGHRDLTVVSPNAAVTKVFAITGYDRLFSIVQTRPATSAGSNAGPASEQPGVHTLP
jgi:anti-anti-sigma factor